MKNHSHIQNEDGIAMAVAMMIALAVAASPSATIILATASGAVAGNGSGVVAGGAGASILKIVSHWAQRIRAPWAPIFSRAMRYRA